MTNPYIGPRRFEEKERDLFFGRDQEAEDLLALVLSNRLVLFYAQSGAGKSSLLNTQLIPRLRDEEGFYLLPTGRVNGELSVDPPNIFSLNLLLSLDKGQQSLETLLPLTLSDYLQAHQAEHEAAWRENLKSKTSKVSETFEVYDHDDDQPFSRVLIIDQFEEIFNTNLHRWSQREAFFQQLRQAMQTDPFLWVILAMREDYLASVDPYAFLLPNALRTRYSMPRLRYQAALSAVQQPAAQAGRPFAAGVAEQLVTNLSQIKAQGLGDLVTVTGEFVEPVQLQVVCYRLWESLMESKTTESKAVGFDSITAADLEQLGNVDQALAQFYEQVVAETVAHGGVDEITLRDWFEQELITEARTRGTVYQGEEMTATLLNDIVRLLARKFILRAEIRAGGTWFELVHDRFIEPILQANLTWRQKQPLLQLAQVWEDAGRTPSNLLEGQALDEALAANWQGLGELVNQYIEASQKLQVDKVNLEREAKLKVEEARRQEIEIYNHQLQLRARWLAGSLIFALLMALSAGGFGWQAIQSKEAAEMAQETAEAASTVAHSEREEAIQLRDNLANKLATELAKVTNSTPSLTLTVEIAETVGVDLAGTAAAVKALQTQVAEVRARQTEVAQSSMVVIPAGPFTIGNTQAQVDAAFEQCKKSRGYVCDKALFEDEMPQHTVTLDSYEIDKYEVTNAQYAQCVKADKCTVPYETKSYTQDSYYGNPQFDNYPVVYIDWTQAKNYCAWQGKRLPTEAEWEKAARGTDGRIYPWGNEFDGTKLNYCDKNCPFDWADKAANDGYGDTAPVGSYPSGASPYGVYDLAGNVQEWTSSDYKEYPYQADDGRENLLLLNKKVLRGGSWLNVGYNARMMSRSDGGSAGWYSTFGSRCVR